MIRTYWGNTARLSRHSEYFELTIYTAPRHRERYILYETNPESLLCEAAYYNCDYDEGDDDDYNNPCFEKFRGMSWDSVDMLRMMLEDDKRTGWNQLMPGYSKYECEV